MGGVILGALLALVGCQSEKLVDDSSSQGGQVITLTASRGLGSRTEMGDFDPTTNKRLTQWSSDLDENKSPREKIYVSSNDGSVTGVLTLNPSSLKDDNTTGTFTGYVFGDPAKLDYSVYPVPENGVIDLTTRTSKYVDAPMIGKINSGNVQFENTCAIREVSIPGITGQDFELSANAGGEALKLGATAVVKFDANNKPYLDFTPTDNIVKVENVPNDVFYVPFEITKNKKTNVIFSGKASNQTTSIEITESMDFSSAKPGVLAKTGAKEVHCVNGQIVIPTTGTQNNFENKTPTTSEGEEKESIPTYTMDESVSSTNLTSIPEATNVAVQIKASEEATSATPDEKVLSITTVPSVVTTLIFTETVKTDSDDDGDDNEGNQPELPTQTEAKQKVTLSLPETAEGKSLDLNMPNSTVNVQSKSGEDLNINKVTASTAGNTFIVGPNVTINELVAMQGAIEVSGTVIELARGEGHKYSGKTTVTVKEGGKIPSGIDKSVFEVTYEGDAPVVDEPETEIYEGNPTEREIELKRAAKNGGTFTLSGGGLRLTSPLIVEKDFTLSFSDGAFDGDIGQFVDSKQWKAMVVVMPGATFIYNGGGYFNTGHMESQITCIRMAGGSNKPSKVIMNGGSLIGTYHTILIDEDCSNAEVEINNGSLSCDWSKVFNGSAILNKSNAKVTIKGGHISSCASAVEMWGGQFVMTGGTLESSYQGEKSHVDTNGVADNCIVGSALALYPSAGKVVTSSISNGTFQGISSVYEIYAGEGAESSLSITGGTFDGGINSYNCTNFISGGQFKVQPDANFMADGKVTVLNGDYYTVQSETGGEETTVNTGLLAVVSKVYPDLVTKNADGTYQIITDKAAEVVELALSGQGTIESLDGIENFPNLERLFCNNVGLKTLEISNNQKLKQIEVVGNNLTSLNFSGNPALEIIKCDHQQNNILGSLNVTGNINLRVLECQNNTLTSLDLTGNTNLEEIDCGVNKLSSLDVTNNLKLTKLFLACDNLTSLDVSKLKNLRQLHCTENKISELDITKNTQLTYLNCGNQQGTNITLTLTENQEALWDADWSSSGYWNHVGVVLNVVETIQNGNTSGNNFNNGGVF